MTPSPKCLTYVLPTKLIQRRLADTTPCILPVTYLLSMLEVVKISNIICINA